MKEGRTKERRKKNKFAHCHNLIMAAFIDAHPWRGGGGGGGGGRKRRRSSPVFEKERERESASLASSAFSHSHYISRNERGEGETERDERIFAAVPISLLTEWERARGPLLGGAGGGSRAGLLTVEKERTAKREKKRKGFFLC